MIQARLYNLIPSCLLCLLFVGLSACTSQTSEPISVAIDMPTRETDVLTKSTLVFAQSTASPSPTSTAAESATETTTPSPTAMPTDVNLNNDQLSDQPTGTPTAVQGVSLTPAVQTPAPSQPTLTVASTESEEEEGSQSTTPQETVTVDQTEVAPPVGPGSTTETPAPTQAIETPNSSATPTATPALATNTPNSNSPVATPTATVALGASDSPNVQITVGSARIPVDGTDIIEVEINRINAQVGEVTLSITYDSSIATLISCKMEALTGICSPDGDGFISLSAVNNGNVQPDILLTTLEFQGLSPGNSTIEISQVDSIVNLDGEELNYIIQPGSITVP